jgi:autotransporter-associated beta strand protein
VVTNHGVLKLVRQDQGVFIYSNNITGIGRVLKDVNNNNLSDVTLSGTNNYTGGTIIAGGGVILGDGNPGHGTIVGNVAFTNSPTGQDIIRQLVFNRPEDHTFSGNITGLGGAAVVNAGQVLQIGAGLLTLTGNNTYLGGTTVSNGTLQVGTGGGSGSIGSGPVVNNTLITFNRSGTLNVPGAISGAGAINSVGTGTVTLSGNNTYLGNTAISNGVLVLSGSVGGDVTVAGGSLAPAGLGTIGTLTIQNNLLINSGTVIATLNRLAIQSNSFIRLTNELTLTAGTATAAPGTSLKLLLSGPIPVVGEKYTIFSQPVSGGAGMTMVTPGFTVSNDLAVDGSVTVTATNPAPTITVTRTGNTLNLSWPAAWTGGVHLQAQTNALTRGLSGNWVTIPGTDLNNTYSTPINNGVNVSVFYRLVAP